MKRLQMGLRRVQATEDSGVGKTTYTLYFARQGEGVQSEARSIHNDDRDVAANLVDWPRYGKTAEDFERTGSIMSSSPIFYRGIEDALLAEIEIVGDMSRATLRWIATVVPSGEIYGLEWADHPTGDPTKLQREESVSV